MDAVAGLGPVPPRECGIRITKAALAQDRGYRKPAMRQDRGNTDSRGS